MKTLVPTIGLCFAVIASTGLYAQTEMSARAFNGVNDVLLNTNCEQVNVIFETGAPEPQEQIIVALIYGMSLQRAGPENGFADAMYANVMALVEYCTANPSAKIAGTILGLARD